MAAPQATENERGEPLACPNIFDKGYTSTPTWTYSQNSAAAIEASILKITSSHKIQKLTSPHDYKDCFSQTLIIKSCAVRRSIHLSV